jgi:hypothetical protein
LGLLRRSISFEFIEPVVVEPELILEVPIVPLTHMTSCNYGVRLTQRAPDRDIIRYPTERINLNITALHTICVTGRFLWGTRDSLIYDSRSSTSLGRTSGVNISANLNSWGCRALVVAATSGLQKIRTAINFRIPIYSEQDFYIAMAGRCQELLLPTTSALSRTRLELAIDHLNRNCNNSNVITADNVMQTYLPRVYSNSQVVKLDELPV